MIFLNQKNHATANSSNSCKTGNPKVYNSMQLCCRYSHLDYNEHLLQNSRFLGRPTLSCLIVGGSNKQGCQFFLDFHKVGGGLIIK